MHKIVLSSSHYFLLMVRVLHVHLHLTAITLHIYVSLANLNLYIKKTSLSERFSGDPGVVHYTEVSLYQKNIWS